VRTSIILCLLAVGGCTGAKKTGILVMAHGGSAAWNNSIETTVEPLRKDHPIEIAFGMARASTLHEAVQKLERDDVRDIAVVRMFISGDSFLGRTSSILGLSGDAPPYEPASSKSDGHGGGHGMAAPRRIPSESRFSLSTRGVAESPLVDQILFDRVKALSTNPAEESVLVLAHGPADEAENERWLANMRLRSQRIHEIGAFRHVQCETLREDWAQRRAEAVRRIREYVKAGSADGGRVIVVPFRIAGFGPYKEVLEGLTYVADGRGFCPHPNMTRWIEETAERCVAKQ